MEEKKLIGEFSVAELARNLAARNEEFQQLTLDDCSPLEIAKNIAKRFVEFADNDNDRATQIILSNLRKDHLLGEFFKSVQDRRYLPTDLQTTFNKMREMYGKDLDGAVPANADSFDEKTLADFPTDEIVAWVADLAAKRKLNALNEVTLTCAVVRHGVGDKFLAEELRRRGYEVKAEKTTTISL